MRNAITLALALSLSAIAFVVRSQSNVLQEQGRELDQLKMELKSPPRESSLELQERCAKQARQFFMDDGWNKHPLASFSDHYNAKMNKCFVRLSDITSSSTTIFVLDAFEGKAYANYTWVPRRGKKYWEVPPLECNVTLPTGEEKVCHSSEELDTLSKIYLQ